MEWQRHSVCHVLMFQLGGTSFEVLKDLELLRAINIVMPLRIPPVFQYDSNGTVRFDPIVPLTFSRNIGLITSDPIVTLTAVGQIPQACLGSRKFGMFGVVVALDNLLPLQPALWRQSGVLIRGRPMTQSVARPALPRAKTR